MKHVRVRALVRILSILSPDPGPDFIKHVRVRILSMPDMDSNSQDYVGFASSLIYRYFWQKFCLWRKTEKVPFRKLASFKIPTNQNKHNSRNCFETIHRVLTLTQCEWILYESCHKFFMKATQILYAFCFAQHKVVESNSCVSTFWIW